MTIKIHSKEKFAEEIEALVHTSELTYIEAIMHYMELHSLPEEAIGKLLNKTIKAKLKAEACDLNLLGKKSSKLPI